MNELDNLKKSLLQAIDLFREEKRDLLNLAFTKGGQAAVQKVEEEYDALISSYFEILRRQLDENNSLYKKLVGDADQAAKALEKDIKKLKDIESIINLSASAVGLVGRLLIVLGI